MTAQLPLALDLRHAPGLDDFVVGRNRELLDQLRRALDGDGEYLIFISGPAGSGRSHLLLGQCNAAEHSGLRAVYLPLREHRSLTPAMLEGLEQFDLLAIDDVDTIAGDDDWENALFNLFNRCRDAQRRLLFSAGSGPATLAIRLPDLRSRLSWGLTIALHALDDDGRRDLLQALAERRAMRLPDDVARYLLERAPRHPRDLVDLVDRLDRASLAEKRHLTIPFVRSCLGLGTGA
ncbi:MAG: DnaA regulatory inactivator Hda [Gammaproteobacteria bacterium]|nr:DnaA regulatory inactivator Hda [Gammaproteobacteria bacterium]